MKWVRVKLREKDYQELVQLNKDAHIFDLSVTEKCAFGKHKLVPVKDIDTGNDDNES